MIHPDIQTAQSYPLGIVEWINALTASTETDVRQNRRQERLQAIIRTHEIADGFARAFESIPGDDAEARKDFIERFKHFVETTSELPDQSPLDVVRRANYDQEEDLECTSDTRKTLRMMAEQTERTVDLQYAYEELQAHHGNTTEGEQAAISLAINDIRQRWMLEKIKTLATTNLHDWDRDSAISAVLCAVFPHDGGVRS
jgi:hypothetical protein